MTEYMNDLPSVFNVIDFSKIFMFIFILILAALVLISIIKIGYSVKEFTEKVVDIVVQDIKSKK